jgi:hypothetical protein
MDALFIEETKGTPRVSLSLEGEMHIEGRSLPEDPVQFYLPVLEWVRKSTVENVTIYVRLDYMNTSSSKELYLFFKYIKQNIHVKTVIVNWYYEEGDDDVYEIGREFEAIVDLPFYYHTYAEAFDEN